jgi:hypothetical protein
MPSVPTIEFTDEFSFTSGYFPNQSLLARIPQVMFDGSNVWVRGPGNIIGDNGFAAPGSAGGAISPAMVSQNQLAGLVGGGVVTDHSGVPWFEGPGGPAFLGGANLGSSNGLLIVYIGGVGIPAGLHKPGPPLIDLLGGPSVKVKGSYSIAVATYRPSTGAVSTRSDFSNVVFGKNTKMRIIQPGSLPDADPSLMILIYGTLRGYGSIGPQFRVTTIAAISRAAYLNAAAAPIEIEFYDGDLGDLAFLANDPPLPGTACVSMGATMVDLGILNGYGISPSNQGFSEAFDVTKISFLAAKESITNVIPYSAEGVVYISTQQSLNLLVITGSDVVPVLPRGLWPTTGFGPGGLCLAGHTIYGFSGQMGAVRTQGTNAPDWSFALPVVTKFQELGFTANNTTVVYAPDQGAVLFCSGNKCLPFMLAQEIWGPPITLPGVVTAGTTVGNKAVLLVGALTYNMNSGNGAGVNGFIKSGYHEGPLHHPYSGQHYAHNLKWIRVLSVFGSDAFTYEVLKDGGNTNVSSLYPWTPTNAAYGHRRTSSPCKNYSLKVSNIQGGQKFHGAQLEVEIDPTVFGLS